VFSCPGASVTLAWDASTSSDVFVYTVKYGTSPGIYTAQESAGLSLSKTISGLPDGFRYYFVVTCKSPTGESDVSNMVTYSQPTTNPAVYITIQAEDAGIQAPMEIRPDLTALGEKYAVSTNNNAGILEFFPHVPFVDEYVIWARILSPDDGHDSFYVSLNSEPEDVYDTVRVYTNDWRWTTVNGRGGSDKPIEDSHKIDPRLFILSGSDKVTFRGREEGTPIDAILITNDRGVIPLAPPAPINLQLTVELAQ